MDEDVRQLKAKFERFAMAHFGDYIVSTLSGFDEEDGYHDQIINAMWIGFCAHATLHG